MPLFFQFNTLSSLDEKSDLSVFCDIQSLLDVTESVLTNIFLEIAQ